jgi:predicted SprT family Zn-dependent metalloprotease
MTLLEVDPLTCVRDDLRRWASTWDLPEIPARVSLRTSTRFKTTLGRFRPDRFEITLAAWLLEAPEALLREVAGHEAAHAAVHLRYGPGSRLAGSAFGPHGSRIRPHGPEWRAFMGAIGLPARVRVPPEALPDAQRLALSQSTRWRHRCPACHATRMARTRVTRWRCARCHTAGRSGALIIERIDATAGSETSSVRRAPPRSGGRPDNEPPSGAEARGFLYRALSQVVRRTRSREAGALRS